VLDGVSLHHSVNPKKGLSQRPRSPDPPVTHTSIADFAWTATSLKILDAIPSETLI